MKNYIPLLHLGIYIYCQTQEYSQSLYYFWILSRFIEFSEFSEGHLGKTLLWPTVPVLDNKINLVRCDSCQVKTNYNSKCQFDLWMFTKSSFALDVVLGVARFSKDFSSVGWHWWEKCHQFYLPRRVRRRGKLIFDCVHNREHFYLWNAQCLQAS